MFNPAKNLIERLRLEEEQRIKRGEADSDEEAFVEISQPHAGSAAAGREEEEPVTEIEHIHYDDDAQGNADSDSDDSD